MSYTQSMPITEKLVEAGLFRPMKRVLKGLIKVMNVQ